MKKLLSVHLIILCLTSATMANELAVTTKPAVMQVALKPREPNWRGEIVSVYPAGNPQVILFFQPLADGTDLPVKQINFYENGAMQTEMDVALVAPDSPLAKEWKSTIVPNGVRIDFSPKGEVLRAASYQVGVIDGECRHFYPTKVVKSIENYSAGKREGKLQFFHEEGNLKEEGFFAKGEPIGEFIQYDQAGKKLGLTSYVEGKIQGKATEWYPNGAVKVERLFEKGQLHGDGKTPALIVYDEERAIKEVLDFREGKAVGAHTRYHKNGQESYKANFKNGLKIGKELFLAADGTLVGEGAFIEGKPIGKHWRKYDNGTMAYCAEFDQASNTIQPIREYNEEGLKIREYSLLNEKLQGPYTEWHANGNVKIEYNYLQDVYEGIQKQFYPSGQIKTSFSFKNGQKDGLQEEWAENGILLQKSSFAQGLLEGTTAEWYPNGTCKREANFSANYPHGLQTRWYENGQLKERAEFATGLKNGWQHNWNENGELTFEARFEKDLPVSTVMSWWGPDKLRMRLNYENGKKEGRQESYHENGTPEQISFFHEDLAEGEIKAWYADGSLKLQQQFKVGKPVGTHAEYYPKDLPLQKDEDRLARVLSYDENGAIHGSEITYFPHKKIQSLCSYAHGALEGPKRLWDQEGNLIEEGTYLQGKLDGHFFKKMGDKKEIVSTYKNNLKNGLHQIFSAPDKEGKKVKLLEVSYLNDLADGMLNEYNEQGIKVAQTPFKAGVKEGIATIFAPNGMVKTTIEFQKNEQNGLVVHYAANGSIARETNFAANLREGEEKTYHEDGTLASICHYHLDKLDGLAQNWNPEGVLVFEAEYKEGLRHGAFKKYFEDGSPYLVQQFAFDLPHGEKHKYEQDGSVTVSHFSDGKLIKKIR